MTPLFLYLVNHLGCVVTDVGGYEGSGVRAFVGIDVQVPAFFVREGKPDGLPYCPYPGLEPRAGFGGLPETAVGWMGGKVTQLPMDMRNHVTIAEYFLTEVVEAALAEYAINPCLLRELLRHLAPVGFQQACPSCPPERTCFLGQTIAP